MGVKLWPTLCILKKISKEASKEREGREKDSIWFKTVTDQVENKVCELHSYSLSSLQPQIFFFLRGIGTGVGEPTHFMSFISVTKVEKVANHRLAK